MSRSNLRNKWMRNSANASGICTAASRVKRSDAPINNSIIAHCHNDIVLT